MGELLALPIASRAEMWHIASDLAVLLYGLELRAMRT